MEALHLSPHRAANEAQHPRTCAATSLADLVRCALGVDAVVLDLRGYAERRRRTGQAEALGSAGAFDGGDPQSELQLHALADPIHAYRAGYYAYAGVPIHARGGATLGTIAALAYADRAFDESALQILRKAAATVADLLDANQPAS
ncbi:GAF domain-containing protein [Sphingomonas sp. MMS12-HWE2-04]|uniref:GAF domain-containing protein n=1 Tax=Sphingomonas sp. MMS12-HWE2-04 TaxID=3234199 RepID=UPI00384DE7F0